MRHGRLRTLGALCVLAGSLCAACRASPPAPPEKVTAVDAAAADADVTNYQLRALEARVQAMPEGTERDYFGGWLAVRSGRFDEGIAQLTRAVPRLRESAPARAALALEALATASLAISHYGEAAQAYEDLSAHFADHLDPFPANDAALAHLLSGTPPPTITWLGPVRLKTSINPIGSRVAELTVNGAREQWLLDTGANLSLVTRSFAERLGLQPLPGVVDVGSGLTGFQSSMQMAVLPALALGGATLQHVAVGILDDRNLRVGPSGADAYQIHAILGYPALRALGAFTFTRDGEFRAGDAERPTSGTRIYMRGLAPAIECEVAGRPLLFTFDTGASSTDLSVRYYELFKHESGAWKQEAAETGGAGGTLTQTIYRQPTVVMKVGPATVTLNDVSILSARRKAAIDILFGNLGQDFVEGFESFSMDLSSMIFSVAPRRQ